MKRCTLAWGGGLWTGGGSRGEDMIGGEVLEEGGRRGQESKKARKEVR